MTISSLMTIDEVAELLRLKKSTIYSYTCRELIPHIKIGSKLLFDGNDIAKWVEEKKSK